MGRSIAMCLFLVLVAACAREGATKIHQPIAVDLGRFESCRIEIVSPLPDGPRATSAFVAYFEGRLREEAVLEPVATENTGDAEIVIRIRPATAPTRNAVALAVEIALAKENQTVGAFEVSGEQEDMGGGLSSGPRGIALQRAADAIAATMKASRRAATRAARRERAVAQAAPPKPLPPAEDPFAARPPNASRPLVCLSTCELPSSSSISDRELQTLTIRIDPTLQTLRACLHRVGAELVEPAVLLRFGDGGRLVGMRVDVGGYENLTCVSDVWAEPPRIATSRPAIVRCLFHCSSPPREEPD